MESLLSLIKATFGTSFSKWKRHKSSMGQTFCYGDFTIVVQFTKFFQYFGEEKVLYYVETETKLCENEQVFQHFKKVFNFKKTNVPVTSFPLIVEDIEKKLDDFCITMATRFASFVNDPSLKNSYIVSNDVKWEKWIKMIKTTPFSS